MTITNREPEAQDSRQSIEEPDHHTVNVAEDAIVRVEGFEKPDDSEWELCRTEAHE